MLVIILFKLEVYFFNQCKMAYLIIFQNLLNFTYTLKKPNDGKYGALKENGRWTGMIGVLQRNEANFGKNN